MTAIQLTFPWGRYYAHPWGINPARLREPEWPPSPWRLLRALVSTWFRAHPGQVPSAECVALVEALGRELPEIGMGKISFGYTVHWQPNYGAASTEDKAEASYKNTRHENHFAAVPGPVFFRWQNVTLAPEHRRLLETLLAELTYFGRAESLCHAERCETEPGKETGWCLPPPTGQRKISATCRDVFCPIPGERNFRFTDLWSRRAAELAPDSPDAPPHLVDALLSSDMKADGAAWFSYQMPDGWPAEWVVRTPRTARAVKKTALSEGKKVAHYLCFSLQCRVPLQPKFIVPLSEQFREKAGRLVGNDGASFALFGHAKDRPADIVGDHQHAFYLPMSEPGNTSRFLSDLHIWCPYGFTQAEIEILLRVNRLDWGSCKYPVRPVLTALCPKEPPADVPFSTGKIASRLWRSASPFVPPRYFYRCVSGKRTFKVKDQPEYQLIECLKAAGVATGGYVWRQTQKDGVLSRLESMPPLPQWDVVRAPGADQGTLKDAVAVAVHQSGSNRGRSQERRVGLFFEIEFAEPVSLPIPALGHSSHFGLGLFVPASPAAAL